MYLKAAYPIWSSFALPPPDSLPLESVEPDLRQRVISKCTFLAHRASHAVVLKPGLKSQVGVLTAPIGVIRQTRCRPPLALGDGQRVGNDLRGLARPE